MLFISDQHSPAVFGVILITFRMISFFLFLTVRLFYFLRPLSTPRLYIGRIKVCITSNKSSSLLYRILCLYCFRIGCLKLFLWLTFYCLHRHFVIMKHILFICCPFQSSLYWEQSSILLFF